jgi:hypothetical protein
VPLILLPARNRTLDAETLFVGNEATIKHISYMYISLHKVMVYTVVVNRP